MKPSLLALRQSFIVVAFILSCVSTSRSVVRAFVLVPSSSSSFHTRPSFTWGTKGRHINDDHFAIRSSIGVEDLQPGDVLCFSPAGDCLSQLIVLLTNENVSHNAIMYNATIIVEDSPGTPTKGVALSNATERFKGRTVTVNRLKGLPPSLGCGPVLAAANKYLEQGSPYSWTSLIVLAIILLQKEGLQEMPPAVSTALTNLIKALAASPLPPWLDVGKGMFCSQFVFQCFQDAGPPYELKIKDGVVDSRSHLVEPVAKMSSGTTLAPNVESGALTNSILGQAIQQLGEWDEHQLPFMNQPSAEEVDARISLPPLNPGAILEGACGAITAWVKAKRGERLSDAGDSTTAETSSPLDQELVLAIADLALVMQSSLSTRETGTFTSGKEFMEASIDAMKALTKARFVTPADLLNRCENLELFGVIEI